MKFHPPTGVVGFLIAFLVLASIVGGLIFFRPWDSIASESNSSAGAPTNAAQYFATDEATTAAEAITPVFESTEEPFPTMAVMFEPKQRVNLLADTKVWDSAEHAGSVNVQSLSAPPGAYEVRSVGGYDEWRVYQVCNPKFVRRCEGGWITQLHLVAAISTPRPPPTQTDTPTITQTPTKTGTPTNTPTATATATSTPTFGEIVTSAASENAQSPMGQIVLFGLFTAACVGGTVWPATRAIGWRLLVAGIYAGVSWAVSYFLSHDFVIRLVFAGIVTTVLVLVSHYSVVTARRRRQIRRHRATQGALAADTVAQDRKYHEEREAQLEKNRQFWAGYGVVSEQPIPKLKKGEQFEYAPHKFLIGR